MSISSTTLQKLSTKVKNKFKSEFKISSFDSLLNEKKEEKIIATVVKPIAVPPQIEKSYDNTATQII